MSLFDWFKRDWHNSNPEKRTQAIRNLDESHQTVFAEKAVSDPDKAVRIEAVKKLTSLEILRQTANSDPEESIRKQATLKLYEEIVVTLKAFRGEPSEVELKLAEEIAVVPQAEDAYKSITIPKLRLALIQNTNKQTLLLQAALRDLNEDVSVAAVENLKNEKFLQDVADNSRHVQARRTAAAKLKATRTENNEQQNAENLLNKKRTALLAQAEYLSEAIPVLDQEEAFKNLIQEAKTLGMGDMQEKLTALEAAFFKKVKETREKQEEAARIAREQAEKQVARENLLKDLETLATETPSEEFQAKLNDCKERLAQIAEGAEAEWSVRIQTAVYRCEKAEKAYRQTLAEQAAELEEQNLAGATRQDLLNKLKALAETETDAFTEKTLRTLVRFWEALPLLDGEEPELKQYNELRSRLNNQLTTWKEAAQREFEEKSEILKKLIQEVKEIDENSEFREISVKLREIFQKWKDIVGKDKFKYQELWKEYIEAQARFQEMRQWESWHNEQDKDAMLAELEKLAAKEPSEEVLDKTRKIIAQWKESGPVSTARFLEYRDHYKELVEKIFGNCASILEAKQEEREENLKKKEELCARVEALLQDTETPDKEKYKAVKQIQEDWKAIGQVPREKLSEIWERFRALIDTFFTKHKEALKVEDSRRLENYEKKIKLCEQAESLAESFEESTDWAAGTAAFKKLQSEWKTSGGVPKNLSEEVWQRFRNACDKFFEKRRAHFESLDAEKQENLKKKNAVCEKLETMAAVDATEEALQAIAEEWKQIGMVPKENVEALVQRYMRALDHLIAERAKSDPALAERLNAIATRKKEIIERINELSATAGVAAVAETVRELHGEWKTLGSAGEQEQELYQAFRTVCDEFFARRRDQMEIQEEARKNNLQKKQLLCEQAEELLSLEEESSYNLVNNVKQLRHQWKEIGPVPREHSDKIWKRFNQACDAVFAKARPNNATNRNSNNSSSNPAAE